MENHVENEKKAARSELLTQAYERLDREVLFGNIPLSADDLNILREVRRSLRVFCPKWYQPVAYNKQVVDPLIAHLIAIGYRAAKREAAEAMQEQSAGQEGLSADGESGAAMPDAAAEGESGMLSAEIAGTEQNA